jgi:NAD(P)H dehydrogenase (quinone)
MAKILVVYYSMYGHIEKMANAVVEGVREVEGVDVVLKRVPELIDDDKARAVGVKLDQPAPIASPKELDQYDGIIIGTPTRFGNMAAQMRNFWDQTGSLWATGALIGKVGSVFTSTAVGGGNEFTILSTQVTLLHQGLVIVGLPYSCPQISDITQPRGGSPYGAGCLANSDGSRQPSENELAQARFQGKYVAEITRKLHR